MNKPFKKLLAILLALPLLFSGLPSITAGAEGENCAHIHDETCGYVEGVPCGYVHTHDENCGYDSDTDSGCADAHVHDENCGYIEAVPCGHAHDEDCGGPSLGVSGNIITFDITVDEYGSTALYLPQGKPVTDADLLAGVTATDENGDAVPVTIADVGGLDRQSPVPKREGVMPRPYIITYEAAHPHDADVTATAAREAYVIVGIMAASGNVTDEAGLKAAVASTGSGNVILSNNITINHTDSSGMGGGSNALIIEKNPTTIDLNGNSLTVNVSGNSANGIKIASGVTLTIIDSNPGTNKLTVANNTAGYIGYGAGINVTDGALIIGSGTVDATGDGGGAGIGGGNISGGAANGGSITIRGTAKVKASNGTDSGGAGIGGGAGGSGGTTIIEGDAEVEAYGGAWGGAGIGGGDDGGGGTITIGGNAIVTAYGGYGPDGDSGAGIGGGRNGAGGTITIGGSAQVTATGGAAWSTSGYAVGGGAGIGSGGGHSSQNSGNSGGSGNITIEGTANVTATGGSGDGSNTTKGNAGAGIGSGGAAGNGTAGSVDTLSITTTGTVTATGGAGDSNGASAGANIGQGGADGGAGTATIHVINATAGTGGNILPSGAVSVTPSTNQTFTITPNTGYAIKEVLVDSSNVPAAVTSGSYEFTNVTGDHTIAATFITTPTLTLSAAPSGSLTLPGSVTLTAALSGAAGGNSGKIITFTVNGATHTATTNSSGAATYTLTNPSAGTYSFGASFAGDANNQAATAAGITGYSVGLGAQQTLNISGLGSGYTYGALPFTLSTLGGSGSGAVSFSSSEPSVASVQNNTPATGQATVTILKAGTFTITATKAGNAQYAQASVTSGTITVAQANPTVALSGNNVAAGQNVTLTATVSGAGATPTGTVTFKEGGTTLATQTLSGGTASHTVISPTSGDHYYTVEYSGQAGYYNTGIANKTIGVNKTDQTGFAIVPPGTITYGDTGVALTASGGQSTGGVTFSVQPNNVLSITSGGAVTVIGAGAVTVTAARAGDTTYNEATAALIVTVQPRDISNVTVTVTGDKVYTGSQLQPVFSVSDGSLSIDAGDYFNDYGANINAGTDGGSVTLHGQRNYTGTKTVTFDIEKRSLTGAVITLSGTSFTSTGAAITPSVTSVVVSGITVPASEYDVGYTNNVNAGTATVTVTAKAASNNFSGSANTTFIITTAPTPTPTPSRDSDSGGSSYTPTATTTAPTETWLDASSAAALAAGAKSRGEDFVRTRSTITYGIRAAAWARFAGLRYEHDTVADGAVQVRVSVKNPEKLTKDTLVSGYVKGSDVDKVKAHFEKWFKNKLRVIHFDQQGAWGQPVSIAAKVDLTGMDTNNLYFYVYDKATNSYKRIEKPAYWIDKNGFIHFTTELAGDIIISDGPLERK